MTKTLWFSGNVKPVRAGVYERRLPSGLLMYSQWNGQEWMRFESSVKKASIEKHVSVFQSIDWRGLTKKSTA